MRKGTKIGAMLLAATSIFAISGLGADAQDQAKPNILVIFGDDVGQTNISAYSFGLVGYRTPNIDRLAKEGMMFTDYYAENSCTAGRSSFITGQTPKRTGLSKVGIPGAPVGIQDRDITIAQALKSHGYVTGQFGKNHLGDRDEFLPTNHGFDEFYGNLYHLNAEEEPERPYWPKDDEAYVKANTRLNSWRPLSNIRRARSRPASLSIRSPATWRRRLRRTRQRPVPTDVSHRRTEGAAARKQPRLRLGTREANLWPFVTTSWRWASVSTARSSARRRWSSGCCSGC